MSFEDIHTDTYSEGDFTQRRQEFQENGDINEVETKFEKSKRLWKIKSPDKVARECKSKYKTYHEQCKGGERLNKLRKVITQTNGEYDDTKDVEEWCARFEVDLTDTKDIRKICNLQKELGTFLDMVTQCIDLRIQVKYNCRVIHQKSTNIDANAKSKLGHDEAIKRQYFYRSEGIRLLDLINDRVRELHEKNTKKRREQDEKRREQDEKRRKQDDDFNLYVFQATSYSKKYKN